MVDPGAAQLIVKYLNRWYRRRAQPRGTMDHFYRGTRMSYNRTYRTVICLVTAIMVSLAAAALLLLPGISHDKDGMSLFAKIFAISMAALGVFASLRAFCEFVVVTDDGLLKSNLFGRKTQMAWNEILRFRVNTDDNKVTISGNGKHKLTMSLSYNGWQDFMEMARRRLNPDIYETICNLRAGVNTKPPTVRRPKKPFWKKPFATKRSP